MKLINLIAGWLQTHSSGTFGNTSRVGVFTEHTWIPRALWYLLGHMLHCFYMIYFTHNLHVDFLAFKFIMSPNCVLLLSEAFNNGSYGRCLISPWGSLWDRELDQLNLIWLFVYHASLDEKVMKDIRFLFLFEIHNGGVWSILHVSRPFHRVLLPLTNIGTERLR